MNVIWNDLFIISENPTTNLWKSSVNKSFPDQHDKKENSTVDSSVPSYRDKNTSASLVKKVHVNQSYFRHVSLQHVRHPLLGQQEPSRAVVDVSSTAIEDLDKHNV